MSDQELEQKKAAEPAGAGAPDAAAAPGRSPGSGQNADVESPAAGPALETAPHETASRETDFESAGIKTDINMLRDVELNITAELGRTKMTIGEITNLTGLILNGSKRSELPHSGQHNMSRRRFFTTTPMGRHSILSNDGLMPLRTHSWQTVIGFDGTESTPSLKSFRDVLNMSLFHISVKGVSKMLPKSSFL